MGTVCVNVPISAHDMGTMTQSVPTPSPTMGTATLAVPISKQTMGTVRQDSGAATKVGGEETVEKVLAGFATDR